MRVTFRHSASLAAKQNRVTLTAERNVITSFPSPKKSTVDRGPCRLAGRKRHACIEVVLVQSFDKEDKKVTEYALQLRYAGQRKLFKFASP